MDTAELVVYLCLLLSAVAIGPLIARHVAGRTEVVEEAVRGMAHTTRFWARLAGTMHLTWFGILLLSSAVLVREYFDPELGTGIGAVAFVLLGLDVSVFITGKPSRVVLTRYRDLVR